MPPGIPPPSRGLPECFTSGNIPLNNSLYRKKSLAWGHIPYYPEAVGTTDYENSRAPIGDLALVIRLVYYLGE